MDFSIRKWFGKPAGSLYLDRNHRPSQARTGVKLTFDISILPLKKFEKEYLGKPPASRLKEAGT